MNSTSITDGVEYVTFTDHITGTKYRFDVTFFLSHYNCTWGRGCKGVDNVPTHGCCEGGAFLATNAERNFIMEKVALLTPDDWENHGFEEPIEAVEDEETQETDGYWQTATHEGTCVFLNSDGGCALHVGALRHNEDFRDWKPEACWLHPLHFAEVEDGTAEIGPLRRHDHWADRNVGWWCIDDTVNYSPKNNRAYEFFFDELVRLTSADVADEFFNYCQERVMGKLPDDFGMPIGGRKGRLESVPVTLTRKQ